MTAQIAFKGLPRIEIVYHHAGRLRLRGAVLERSTGQAAKVRGALAGTPGVERVAHNALSGSVLVEYAPETIDADAILSRVLETGLRLDGSGRRPDATRAVVGAARTANSHVAEMTGGAADLHGVVSFVLGVGAVGSLVLARQPRWPRWDNLLYWSYAFFREVHVRDLERAQPRRSAR